MYGMFLWARNLMVTILMAYLYRWAAIIRFQNGHHSKSTSTIRRRSDATTIIIDFILVSKYMFLVARNLTVTIFMAYLYRWLVSFALPRVQIWVHEQVHTCCNAVMCSSLTHTGRCNEGQVIVYFRPSHAFFLAFEWIRDMAVRPVQYSVYIILPCRHWPTRLIDVGFWKPGFLHHPFPGKPSPW